MKPSQLTSVVYPVSFNPETQSYVHTIRLYMTDEVGNLYVANPNDQESAPKWVLNVPAPGEEKVKGEDVRSDAPAKKEYVTSKPSPYGVDLKKKNNKTEGEQE